MIRRFSNIKILILIAFLATSLTGEAFAASPSEIVERFQASPPEVMKGAKTLAVQQRYSGLSPSLEKSFHIPLMIQIASAGHAKESTKTERRLLKGDAVERLTAAFDDRANPMIPGNRE